MIIATFDVGLVNAAVCVFDTCTSTIQMLRRFSVLESGQRVPNLTMRMLQTTEVLESLRDDLMDCEAVYVERQLGINRRALLMAMHVLSWASSRLPNCRVVSEMHAGDKTRKLGLGVFGAWKERKKACEGVALDFLLATQDKHADILAEFLCEPKRDDLGDVVCMALTKIRTI